MAEQSTTSTAQVANKTHPSSTTFDFIATWIVKALRAEGIEVSEVWLVIREVLQREISEHLRKSIREAIEADDRVQAFIPKKEPLQPVGLQARVYKLAQTTLEGVMNLLGPSPTIKVSDLYHIIEDVLMLNGKIRRRLESLPKSPRRKEMLDALEISEKMYELFSIIESNNTTGRSPENTPEFLNQDRACIIYGKGRSIKNMAKLNILRRISDATPDIVVVKELKDDVGENWEALDGVAVKSEADGWEEIQRKDEIYR